MSLFTIKRFRQRPRPNPVIVQREDNGRRTMDDLMFYLYNGDELNKNYSWFKENCKDFSVRVFDHITRCNSLWAWHQNVSNIRNCWKLQYPFFLVADTQLYIRGFVRPSVGPTVRQSVRGDRVEMCKHALLWCCRCDSVCEWVCVGWARVWSGVGRPCPPVRIDIVTPCFPFFSFCMREWQLYVELYVRYIHWIFVYRLNIIN